MTDQPKNIIIYNTIDGKASVALYAKDGKIWLNLQQMAALGSAALLCKELFGTSKQAASYQVINMLQGKELPETAVVKQYSSTGICLAILNDWNRRTI